MSHHVPELADLRKEREDLKRAGALHSVHWVIIASSLLLTLGASYIVGQQIQQKNERRFVQEAQQIVELITESMNNYEDALWAGVATIYSQSHGIDYAEWKRFASGLQVEERHPGINGIGVIYPVMPPELEEFLAREREMRPDFYIHPSHEKNEYWPITYIEPLENNYKAVGLDMAHETNRFEAAKRARDTGDPQITGPIVLVQDAKKTPGFLFYAPFYKGDQKGTFAQRQDNFSGLVYAPFIFENLMAGTLQVEKRRVVLRIRDQGASDNVVLYDELQPGEEDFDPNPLFMKTLDVNMYGRIWQVEIWSGQSFREQSKSNEPLVILIGGLFIDTMLLVLFLILARTNRRALHFADQMSINYQKKAEDLASANAELEEFAYRTSHDLRSPLVSSLGLLDVAEESTKDGNQGQVLESIGHMRAGLEKLKNLVEDILVLTKTKSAAEEEQDVDVQEIIDEALETLQHMENFKRLEVRKRFAFTGTLNLKKMRLNMIVENLLSNAVKYQDIEKEGSYIEISTYEEDDAFVLSVKDNGLGIPHDQQDKIFSMFKRFHPKVSYGSGLGLYMVQKSADVLGGHITYEDQGDGSIFTLVVPL